MSTRTPIPSAMMDDAWLAAPPRRSRLRLVLVGLLVAGLVFLAGVEVQKRYGPAGGAGGSATAGMPAGFGTAGAGGPGAGGFPGGSPGATAGAAPSASASGSDAAGGTPAGGTAASSSAVIGTVTKVDGDLWTVTDLGGAAHQVTVDSGAAIVRESQVAAKDIATGTTVDISGSTDDQGQVTATTVTVR